MTEDAPREPHSFEFSCDGPAWKGIPVVNGHKITSASRIDVRIDPRGLPEVVMRLSAADALKLGLDTAAVTVDDGTREALVSLGWAPPADGGSCACGSVHPEGYACTQDAPEPCGS